jgi:hypothetical protein
LRAKRPHIAFLFQFGYLSENSLRGYTTITIEMLTDNILKFKVSAKLEESDFARIAPQVEEMIKSQAASDYL